jgi:magnesium-protoporphyrin O-methyltransferase
MTSCQCQGIESCFNQGFVDRELARYRRRGLEGTTRILVEALVAAGVEGLTLLDVGGGVGAIQHALLQTGVSSATDVDASTAYTAAAREEAQRLGLADRMRFVHGNFVDLAPEIPPADIVTLDRVICCYADMRALVGLSAERARRLYGVVYPRGPWWMRTLVPLFDAVLRAFRNPFQFYVHDPRAVEDVVRAHGLERRFYRKTGLWQVIVYARPGV